MKKIFSTIIVFLLCFGFSLNVSATEINLPWEISATIINNETGEHVPVEVALTILPETRMFSEEKNSSQNITATAIFKIPVGAKPRYTDTATTTTDVEATISMNYDRQGEKIRVNKIYGSWKPATSMIQLSNREVIYGDGVPFVGKSAHKYPTSNSYSYTTGWGWVDFYPASTGAASGARAYSSANVSVSGMSGSHLIEVYVTARN